MHKALGQRRDHNHVPYLRVKFTHNFIHIKQHKQLFWRPLAFRNSIPKTKQHCHTSCSDISKTLIHEGIKAFEHLVTNFAFPSKKQLDLFKNDWIRRKPQKNGGWEGREEKSEIKIQSESLQQSA